MAKLQPYDHELFESTVQGLVNVGWKEEGGSPIFRLLHNNDGASIKVFRSEEAPAVIKICWTAPPFWKAKFEEVSRHEVKANPIPNISALVMEGANRRRSKERKQRELYRRRSQI